jgi:hypothetical protein
MKRAMRSLSSQLQLRQHILHARLFREGDEWHGDVRLDDKDRNKVDPHTVYEFAKGLAGPLAQLHFYPKSVSAEVEERLEHPHHLLGATKRALNEVHDL